MLPPIRIGYSDQMREEIAQAVDRVVRSGWLMQHEEIERFEREFCALQAPAGQRLWGAAVNSCTTGLEFALRTLVPDGKTVLVPANTFVATALAVEAAGMTPVVVDVSPEDGCLTVDGVAQANERHPADAVVVVHIGGVVSDEAAKIRSYCDARGLWLVEDCAHAHGCADSSGRPAGLIGHAGAVSFSATKTVPIGEGGMVVSAYPDVIEVVRELRDYGKTRGLDGPVSRRGHSRRVSEFTAAVGRVVVSHAARMFGRRVWMAEQLDKELGRLEGAKIVRPPGASSFYKYSVLVGRHDHEALRAAMRGRGVILASRVYGHPWVAEPLYQDLVRARFPGAWTWSDSHVCLPIYADAEEGEPDHIARALRESMTALGH